MCTNPQPVSIERKQFRVLLFQQVSMLNIDPILECKHKAQNVQTAVKSVIFDEFQNLYLVENYLQCLIESQAAVERIIIRTKAENPAKYDK